jgi:hypothetical protein
VHQRLHKNIEEFIDIELIYKLNYYLKEEISTEVVTTAIDCIKELSQMLGPIFLEPWLPDLSQALK